MASSSSAVFLPSTSWAATVNPEHIPALLTQLAALQSALAARLISASSVAAPESVLVDAGELADRLGVPETHIRTKARAGEIPCVRVGKYMRFDPAAVAAVLEAAR
ncbi:MAG: helix-turn-helix domain-containing protein [Candidatus Binataceae bacterium]